MTFCIELKTKVKGHYIKNIEAFDRSLFEALKPPIGKMEIVQFTGSKKGDKVHIQFISPVRATWISDIIEDQITDDEAWFVDVGSTLPWPLKSWRHKHLVQKSGEQASIIIDQMSFSGKNLFWSILLYPAIFLGFYPRKRIYRRYFNELNTI